ncbi:MAG: hypothetical protein LUC34_04325 [Campylobacter sp.]|nr:hypothetical protein [Campylobacter sp.]
MLNQTAKNTAFKLLNKFGKDGIYKRQSGQIYDPETGQMQISFSEHKIKAYIDSAKSYSNLVEKGLINEADNVILIAAKSLPFMPNVNDLIVFPEKTYAVKYNDTIYGGEDIALHQLVGAAK